MCLLQLAISNTAAGATIVIQTAPQATATVSATAAPVDHPTNQDATAPVHHGTNQEEDDAVDLERYDEMPLDDEDYDSGYDMYEDAQTFSEDEHGNITHGLL